MESTQPAVTPPPLDGPLHDRVAVYASPDGSRRAVYPVRQGETPPATVRSAGTVLTLSRVALVEDASDLIAAEVQALDADIQAIIEEAA